MTVRWRRELREVRAFPLVVGRARTCDLVVGHPSVSREHCFLLRDDDRLYVRDLSSRNGVLINGSSIRGLAELHHGDRVSVGAEQLAVLFGRVTTPRPRELAAREPVALDADQSTHAGRAHELLLACVRNAIDDGDLSGAELLGRRAVSVLRGVVASVSDPARLLAETARVSELLAAVTGDPRWAEALDELTTLARPFRSSR